jgi:tRNA pseudouridine65 synthase
MEELGIIYQDQYLVAINKPSGLLVHRSKIDPHETRFALQLLRDQIGQHVYPVHRLDKPTSGVLLFALSSEIARKVSEGFANHCVKKTYLAVVRGFAPEQGTIDHPLKDKADKFADRDKSKQTPAREAVSYFSRLATIELPIFIDRYPQSRYSLLEVQPITGRKHQIRRHLKHIGHPIIGDAKHGKGVHNRFFEQHYDCGRLLLACTKLELMHPVSNEPLQLNAQLDKRFNSLMKRFKWLL